MENKEVLDMVKGLKSQLDELQAKEEKSHSESMEAKALKEQLAEMEEKWAKELAEAKEVAQAETKALEAAMQTPEFAKSVSEKEEMESKQAHAKALKSGVQSLSEVEKKALRTDIDPQGGYLIRNEQAGVINGRVFETSPLREFAEVRTTSNNAVEFILDDDEAAAAWAGEGSPNGETDTANIGKITINTHKLEATPKITFEELEDAYLDVEAWHADKVVDKFRRLENSSFFNGDGVIKPRGILTYDAWASAGVYERDALEQIASGSATTLTGDGVIDLQNSLKEEYQANAVFLMKRATWGVVRKLKDNDGRYLVDMEGTGGLSSDSMNRPMLLGKPVVFCDDMEAVGAGNLPIAYGDFGRGYAIVDRVGIRVLRDPYTSKGFVTYYTTKRTGGGVKNFEAIKLQVVSS